MIGVSIMLFIVMVIVIPLGIMVFILMWKNETRLVDENVRLQSQVEYWKQVYLDSGGEIVDKSPVEIPGAKVKSGGKP